MRLTVLVMEKRVKNNNGSVSSTTHGTNPNGVSIYETIYTLTDPSDNSTVSSVNS